MTCYWMLNFTASIKTKKNVIIVFLSPALKAFSFQDASLHPSAELQRNLHLCSSLRNSLIFVSYPPHLLPFFVFFCLEYRTCLGLFTTFVPFCVIHLAQKDLLKLKGEYTVNPLLHSSILFPSYQAPLSTLNHNHSFGEITVDN